MVQGPQRTRRPCLRRLARWGCASLVLACLISCDDTMKKDHWCRRKNIYRCNFIFTSIKNLPIDRPRDSNIFHVHPPPKLSFDSLSTRPLLVCLVVCKHMTTQKALWAVRQKASMIIESNGANKTYLLPLLQFPEIFCSKFEKRKASNTVISR